MRLGYDKLPKEKILKKHTADIYDKLENMDKLSLSELEEEATKYDAVYFNKVKF